MGLLQNGIAWFAIVDIVTLEPVTKKATTLVGPYDMTNSIKQVKLFGLQVDNLSLRETVEVISSRIESGRFSQQASLNVDKVVKMRKDPQLARILGECDVLNADGMPIVWASRLLGRPLKTRVAGIDLFAALVTHASKQGWPVFFLGAKHSVVSTVVSNFQSQYPQLRIAGWRDGYWQADEQEGIIKEVSASGAKMVFIAISSPKKEYVLQRLKALGEIPFAMGVGGSFDVMSGLVKRAPLWMQDSGLEWFYRFLQEPNRLFKRYFLDALSFGRIFGREYFSSKIDKTKA